MYTDRLLLLFFILLAIMPKHIMSLPSLHY